MFCVLCVVSSSVRLLAIIFLFVWSGGESARGHGILSAGSIYHVLLVFVLCRNLQGGDEEKYGY